MEKRYNPGLKENDWPPEASVVPIESSSGSNSTISNQSHEEKVPVSSVPNPPKPRRKRRTKAQMEEFRRKQLEEKQLVKPRKKRRTKAEMEALRSKPRKRRRTKAEMEEFRRKQQEEVKNSSGSASSHEAFKKIELLSEEILSLKQDVSDRFSLISKEIKNASSRSVILLSENSISPNVEQPKIVVNGEFTTPAPDMSLSSPDFEQPKILRKFRPPLSRSKMRELEKAQKETPVISESELKTEPESTQCGRLFDVIFEFKLVNAWLASKNSSWTSKNMKSLRKMMSKESLISTYKCMGEFCSYVTTSERNFSKHLDCHEESSEIQRFWLNCPYCFFVAESSKSLLKHYREQHQHDKYQCGDCFYRSVNTSSCWEHIQSHHKSQSIGILECPLVEKPKIISTHVRLIYKRKKFVSQLPCSSKYVSFVF
jgi:hypothetical protein